jgi:hypothetical protein
MSDTTTHLGLPYLLAAQAQKHVTHNEALRLLDAMVQLSVLDRTRTAPPASPADGDRHLVASGATGLWTGWDLNIAFWIDGAWMRLVPRVGWQVWVADEGVPLVWTGSAWQDVADRPLQVPRIGVNASSDNTNRLSVSAPATLFTHAGAGHQLKLNKAAATDTASLLFQTGFSGRAELGTAGSDDLSIKVSPDGATWHTAIATDHATGAVSLPNGLSVAGTVSLPAGAVSRAALEDGAALSVIGRSAGNPGAVADIAAASDHQVLRRSGSALGFGAVALNEAAAVTGVLPLANGGTGADTAAAARTNLGLGTAATATVTTSQTDSTTGRLLKVGDFSLGLSAASPVAVPGGNIDAFNIPNGWYYFNNTNAGTLPPETDATFVILQNWWRAPSSIFQMAIHRRFGPDRVVVWVRDSIGTPPSSWTPWRRLYSQSDILGFVSQSDGVPTGAVIERGSNSNGEYVRFADGTQICSQRLLNIAIDNSFGSGGLFRSNTFSWTFPATFVAGSLQGANLFGRVQNPNGLCVQIPYPDRTTQATDIRAFATASVAATNVFLTAIGRWF